MPFRKTTFDEWADELLDDPIQIGGVEYLDPEAQKEKESRKLADSQSSQLREILAEINRRENESLKLYEPMPEQEAFHSSMAGERLILGGNRGGKTLTAAVECARAITGTDPHDKYSKRDGRGIVVGKDLLHCSKVIYRKLFKPGSFRVIYDPITCKHRAFRPFLEWDQANAEKAVPAAPLIPTRFYGGHKAVSWDNRREEIPKSVKIAASDWELSFFSSLGAPPQGWDADFAWFDEEVEHPNWYTETSARLLDRRMQVPGPRRFINGRFIWSATPQAGTQHLYDLYERAENEKGDEAPSITRHEVSLLENVHIAQSAKDDFCKKLEANEDEYAVRVKGQFAILGSRVYPEFFPKGAHGTPSFPIPYEWCRYMAIDPGRQVCAALFVAVPPPGQEHVVAADGTKVYVRNKKIIYDELYIRRSSAAIFAERLKRKLGDAQPIRSWWMDMRAGRITEMGSGYTVEQQYSMEAKKAGLGAETTGHRFSYASDDIQAGISAVRRGLHIREDGPQWLVMHESVPNFLDEAKRYCYRKLAGTNVVTDEPLKRDNHLMDSWRYLAQASLPYHKPLPRKRAVGYTIAALEAKRKARIAKDGKGHIDLW